MVFDLLSSFKFKFKLVQSFQIQNKCREKFYQIIIIYRFILCKKFVDQPLEDLRLSKNL